MAKRGKPTKTRTPQRGGPSAKVVSEGGKLPAKRSAADFVKRRTEVEQKDHAEFQTYLAEKKEADARKARAGAAAPPKSRGMSRRTMFNVAVGTAAAAEAAVIGYNTLGSGSVSDHGLRHAGANYSETPRHRSRGGGHQGRCPGAEPRQLGRPAADQAGRWHLCDRPQLEPRAGLDLVLELRRLQSDQPPSLRLPERRPAAWLRVRQLDAGRPELADLRHADAGHGGDRAARHQHLSRALRRHADAADRERLGNHGAGPRRARHGQSQGRPVLLRDRRPEGHRRLLRSHDLQGEGGAALRLDAQRGRAARRLDEGRHAHHQEDLSRCEDRPVRLSRHQGQQDRLGNGADGRAVRRGRLDARRQPAHADRRRRHDLASRGPLGGHRRAAVRRHLHPRSGEEFRSGRLPAVQQGLAGPVSGRAGRQGHLEGRVRQDPLARATRSASRPTASSS